MYSKKDSICRVWYSVISGIHWGIVEVFPMDKHGLLYSYRTNDEMSSSQSVRNREFSDPAPALKFKGPAVFVLVNLPGDSAAHGSLSHFLRMVQRENMK